MSEELNGYMVKFLQKVEKGKENSLWYGGDVAEIKYKDLYFIITANGSVIGRIYENKELITSFKDTRNMATFYHTINKHLKDKVVTDKDLEEWLAIGTIFVPDKDNYIALDSGNWWECYIRYKGETIEMDYDINSCKISEAIAEVREIIPKIYDKIHEEIVLNNDTE